MRTLMLKIAAAALLVLISVAGPFALPHASPASGAESAITSTQATVSLSTRSDTVAMASAPTQMSVDQESEASAAIIGPPALITAGVCAALVGCCILGFVLLRLHLRFGPRPSLVATVRRPSPFTFAPLPRAWLIRPSLVLFSISRT